MDRAKRGGHRVFDLEHLLASRLGSDGIGDRLFHCLRRIAWDAHFLARASSLAGRLGDFRWIHRAENRSRRQLLSFTTIRFWGFIEP